MTKNKPTRGRPVSITDEKLKEIALDVKAKMKGHKINYLLLEKETGIGRQTWKRRISDFIDEINAPLVRTYSEDLGEQVFLPNIEEIFVKHKNNKEKIINELHQFELMFISLYRELQTVRVQVQKSKEVQEGTGEELSRLKEKAETYERLYKNAVIASSFSHLRSEYGLSNNLLVFSKDRDNNSILEEKGLETLFKNSVKDHDYPLKHNFPHLFSSD